MRKPLIRAGFVSFMIAVFARLLTIIDVNSNSVGQYYLLYAFSLPIAILIWSVAYLHRQRDLKVAGALGVLASFTPIVALIVGHIALGAGAFIGLDALLTAADGGVVNNLSAIILTDVMFAV